MRITLALLVVNAVMIQVINPNFAVRVNDLLVVEHNAHVNDAAFVVIEKSQIAGLRQAYKMHFFAQSHLLKRIARQLHATNAHNLLRKARTI